MVVKLIKPRQSLRGYCRRFLVEPSANLFVGKANRVLFDDLDKRVLDSGIDAVVIAGNTKSDLGLVIRVYGSPDRSIVSLDGFQVILRKSKR
ncbi:MAG: type I-E CRISPR-associated endoribonuclease Cas2 [Opitutaceae bacterium]|nr:type I-E CRISPR-associated endoribonuclease Cas2 [Opitutaceae bacterium]